MEEEDWSPEHALLLAVLERAVLDYQHRSEIGCAKLNPKDRQGLEQFLFYDDEDELCAYKILNLIAGNKAEYILKRLRSEVDSVEMFKDSSGAKRATRRKAHRMA